MAIDSGTAAEIAHLARIEVREDELEAIAGELSSILSMVEQMNAVDTAEVAPMAHPLDARQRLRPDRRTEPDERERFQAGAPAVRDGLYLVPRVIE